MRRRRKRGVGDRREGRRGVRTGRSGKGERVDFRKMDGSKGKRGTKKRERKRRNVLPGKVNNELKIILMVLLIFVTDLE